MDRCRGSDDLSTHPMKYHTLLRTGTDTETAAEADISIDKRNLFLIYFLHVYRFNWAGLLTFNAAYTRVRIETGEKTSRLHGVQVSEFPSGDKCFAATTAAVADKGHVMPDIFPALHQIIVISFVKQLQTL